MNFCLFRKMSYLLIPAFLTLFALGCQSGSGLDESKIEKPEEINASIGEISDIYQSGATEVRGYGIVANLAGTGSSECPDDLRDKLIKHIKVEMVDRQSIDPEAFIKSKNTAVVEVYGVMPAAASKGDVFDLRVSPLSSTQTTSLDGGRLFTTKLVAHREFFNFNQYLKTLALAEGPIFINKLSDKDTEKKGDYVLGGGRVVEDATITMILNSPNYFTASAIRDVLNSQFGPNTARPKSPGEIDLNIPPKYQDQKAKFLAMVRMVYIGNDPEKYQARIKSLIDDLINNEDKLTPETGLETYGIAVVDRLAVLLDHPDEEVRLRAARCMLNNGDDRALVTLRKIIENPESKHRVEAVKAVGMSAKRSDALPILARAIESEDFDVTLAAYEMLVNLHDISVSRTAVAGDFFLDTVVYSGPDRIYLTRKGTPRVVLFGEPLNCEKDIFVQVDDGELILNSRPADKYVSISRKKPKNPGIIGPVPSRRKVKDVIRTLGELPKVPEKSFRRPGLFVPYCDIAVVLEKMCTNGAIKADFIAGDLPDFPSGEMPDTDFLNPSENPNSDGQDAGQRGSDTEGSNRQNRRDWEELLEGRRQQG